MTCSQAAASGIHDGAQLVDRAGDADQDATSDQRVPDVQLLDRLDGGHRTDIRDRQPVAGVDRHADLHACIGRSDQCAERPGRPGVVRVLPRVQLDGRSAQVTGGTHDGRIPWPRCRALDSRGGSGLLVTEELVRAIRTESAAALMHWFGVGERAVWKWRMAFLTGKGKFRSPGSKMAHRKASEAGGKARTNIGHRAACIDEIHYYCFSLEI